MADVWHLKKIESLIGQTIPKLSWPKEVTMVETPNEERQEMLREIDRQRRSEDPDFKGAFHEKQNAPKHSGKKTSSRRK
jgi:ATP-dependent RNA helicase RhlE